MSFNFRIPNLTATNTQDQIKQVHSYLFQVVEQLNWALNTIGDAQSGNTSNVVINNASEEITPKEAENTFNSIKALIIKSADIVKAYEETIKQDFNGEYFADSDFGTYLEQTSTSISTNSKRTEEVYTNVQTITDKVDVIEKDIRTTNAYINRGLLGYDNNGNPIHGVEVGATTEDGAYLRYAQFTADRLSFFDKYDTEVAYIGNGCLYILGTSRFIGDVFFGGYKADTSDGLAFVWVG